jgi:hypothetical protein
MLRISVKFTNLKRPLKIMLIMPVTKELMHALRVRVRKWCLKIKVPSLYFSPKVTYPERLYSVKIMEIRAIDNLTLGHL